MKQGLTYRLYRFAKRWLGDSVFRWFGKSALTCLPRRLLLYPNKKLRLETVLVDRELWEFSFTAPLKVAYQASTRGIENIICWIITRYCTGGMTCVDVGANYGYLTLVMAQQVSPGGTVLSFEPNPNICPVLVRNIGDNGYRSVGRAFECAIAAVDGHMLPFQFPRCDQPIDVLTRTVDSIVAEHDLSALDLIKIDIDGPELEALRGAAESIRKYRPVIVTEVNRQKDEILHFLTDLGYRCFDIRGNEIERAESLELPCNVLACTLPQYQIIYDRLP